MIQSTTITILLLHAFSNYGMDSKEKENNQETIQEKQEIKQEQKCCLNEICQEISEEIISNPQMHKEEIWEQIEKSGIKIEKNNIGELKILFPEIEEIKNIREEIFINFEKDKSKEKINFEEGKKDLNNIFTPHNKEDFIKNGANLPSIKKSIFTSYMGKINYSFCIKPKKKSMTLKYISHVKVLKRKYTQPSQKKKKKIKMKTVQISLKMKII